MPKARSAPVSGRVTRSRSRSRGRAEEVSITTSSSSSSSSKTTSSKKTTSSSPKKGATAKKSAEQSRSRSRSRSRGRSPGRPKKEKAPPTPPREPKITTSTPARGSPDRKSVSPKRPSTPTRIPRVTKSSNSGGDAGIPAQGVRSSSRIAAQAITTTTNTVERTSTRGGRGDAVDSGAAANHSKDDFGGPMGALFCIIFLPAMAYYITVACGKSGCSMKFLSQSYMKRTLSKAYDCEAYGVVLAWYVLQSVIYMLPFGSVVLGQPIGGTGERLKYRCNGMFALFTSLAVVGGLVYRGYDVQFVHQKWFPMFCAANLYSLLLSLALYLKAEMSKDTVLAPTATGNFLNDFFMGRELNPRINMSCLGLSVDYDFKFVVEMRCSLIAWVVADVCFLMEQYRKTGSVDTALAMVCLFHLVYVADGLLNESSFLTTKDATDEGFGFMLVFGTVVWVPFLYSLQARFLLEHPEQGVTDKIALTAIFMLSAIGFALFRGSNSQKDAFRRNPYDPALSHLQSLSTARGRRLLCSSYWGISRHPNYLGDMMMAVAWSLPCGVGFLMPWFYPITLIGLLIHRQWRDEAYCRQSYGATWDMYCEKVPYKIIPYVY